MSIDKPAVKIYAASLGPAALHTRVAREASRQGLVLGPIACYAYCLADFLVPGGPDTLQLIMS